MQIVNEEIKRYDLEAEAAPSQRGDFLAWFRRQQQKDPARFSDFDIFSNCLGNMYEYPLSLLKSSFGEFNAAN